MVDRPKTLTSAARQTALAVLGSRLRAARMQSGFTQAEVAHNLEVSTQSVRNWEAGRTEPSEERVQRMSVLYDVPAEVFQNATLVPKIGALSPERFNRVKVDPEQAATGTSASKPHQSRGRRGLWNIREKHSAVREGRGKTEARPVNGAGRCVRETSNVVRHRRGRRRRGPRRGKHTHLREMLHADRRRYYRLRHGAPSALGASSPRNLGVHCFPASAGNTPKSARGSSH